MNIVSVVIPIYKKTPTQKELLSYKQCLSILNKYPITIVCPDSLAIDYYLSLASDLKNISIERFDDSYFESIYSYNKLMLSKRFYKRFSHYKYILIYQLDAWVFRDELKYWCKKEYDFIGAPFIEEPPPPTYNSIRQGGNGGFSLRNIEYCLKILSYKGPILKPNIISKIVFENKKKSMLFKLISIFVRSFGYHNNVKYFINKTYLNEDMFWSLNIKVSWINRCISIKNSWIKPNLAPKKNIIKFAFERYPSLVFDLNKKELPFGCHAWEKYEYNTFWRLYIIS